MTLHRLLPLVAVVILATSPAVSVAAQTADGQVARPELLSRLVACRSVSESAARLSCYDETTAALDAAEQQGEVVVVAREQISAARRQLFGFSVPALPALFESANQPDQVDAIETTLTRASQNREGRWVFTLADGSVWQQIDVNSVNFRNRGNPAVRVRRGALGSFLLVVGDSRAVRVRRQ